LPEYGLQDLFAEIKEFIDSLPSNPHNIKSKTCESKTSADYEAIRKTHNPHDPKLFMRDSNAVEDELINAHLYDAMIENMHKIIFGDARPSQRQVMMQKIVRMSERVEAVEQRKQDQLLVMTKEKRQALLKQRTAPFKAQDLEKLKKLEV